MEQRNKLDRLFQTLLVLLIAAVAFIVSGCVFNTGTSSQSLQDDKLRKANEQLMAQLEEQEQVIASMQLKLLEKHAEVDRLTGMNERLISEFVRTKATKRTRGDKAETVRLIAEVDTIITTVKEDVASESYKDLLTRAEKYLAESKNELEQGNVDGAFYLANQSLEQAQEVQLISGAAGQKRGGAFVSFAVPLPMKLMETSNIRTGPSTKEKVQFVLGAGETVNAIGYQGQWVNVRVGGRENGWIHSSLLN